LRVRLSEGLGSAEARVRLSGSGIGLSVLARVRLGEGLGPAEVEVSLSGSGNGARI